ncbi:MAG: VOC family protein [Propionibacteriaceae bacterium]|nr:VOC family protein [Propionibacteriaceae bacterium]
MKILAIRFASDLDRVRPFYAALGLALNEAVSGEGWQELDADGGILALHSACGANHATSRVEVCLAATEPLEEIQARLSAAGFDPGEIRDEDFGRSLRVTDPEGLELQING